MRNEWICRDSQGAQWSFGDLRVKRCFASAYDVVIQKSRFRCVYVRSFGSMVEAAKYCERSLIADEFCAILIT